MEQLERATPRGPDVLANLPPTAALQPLVSDQEDILAGPATRSAHRHQVPPLTKDRGTRSEEAAHPQIGEEVFDLRWPMGAVPIPVLVDAPDLPLHEPDLGFAEPFGLEFPIAHVAGLPSPGGKSLQLMAVESLSLWHRR